MTADLQDVDVPLADHVEVRVQVQQQVQHLDSNMENPASHAGAGMFLFCWFVLSCVNREFNVLNWILVINLNT